MRINKFIARATGMSRRSADQVVLQGRVTIDGKEAETGTQANDGATVKLDGKPLRLPEQATTILLNKPAGYVCSRDGQGSATIYDLLPPDHHKLKPIGRLDKDSSGLLLLSNDGELANQLTHPRYSKAKVYEVRLDRPLAPADQTQIKQGVELEDGLSKLELKALDNTNSFWQITMTEGRNRQIRRTFSALDYKVTKLHRTNFGSYALSELKEAAWAEVGQPPEAAPPEPA